jgi:outer membrane protein assembly factor BamB
VCGKLTLQGIEIAVLGADDGGVYAFLTSDGTQHWKTQTGGTIFSSAVRGETSNGTTSNDANADPALWVGSWDHYLYALDASTGAVRGKVDLGTQIRSSAALRIDADGTERVCLSVGHSLKCVEGTPSAVAKAMDVKVSWSHNTIYSLYGSPSFSADGETVFFPPSTDYTAYALDTLTGKVLGNRYAPCVFDCLSFGCMFDASTAMCFPGSVDTSLPTRLVLDAACSQRRWQCGLQPWNKRQ